jgi:hypothetical protein
MGKIPLIMAVFVKMIVFQHSLCIDPKIKALLILPVDFRSMRSLCASGISLNSLF